MSEEIKSGKDVIQEFFAEIQNIKDADERTVEQLLALYKENKLTDTQIQNAMENLKQEALMQDDLDNGED